LLKRGLGVCGPPYGEDSPLFLRPVGEQVMKNEIAIAIISASSALCGVLISQAISLFQTHLSRRHERQKLLRAKYEEMTFFFSDSFEWIERLNNCSARSALLSASQNLAARKCLVLCLLYFPEFVGIANDYIKATVSYYTLVSSSYIDGVPATAGGQAIAHNKKLYYEAVNDLFRIKADFEQLIELSTDKYAKA